MRTNFVELSLKRIEGVAEFLAKYGNDDFFNMIHYCSKEMCPKYEECKNMDHCINEISDKDVVLDWLNQEVK